MRHPALSALLLAAACGTPEVVSCASDGTCVDSGAAETDTPPAPDTDQDSDLPVDTDVEVQVASCADLGIETLALEAGGSDAEGRYTAWGRFPAEDGTLVTGCGDAGPQVVLTFAVPTTGAWHLTTDGPGTTSDATLSLRGACDDATERACDARGVGPHGATLVVDATAGEVLTVVVEGDDEARGWQLTAAPVSAQAEVGASCDATHPCVTGASCAGDDAGVCVATSAPVFTSHDIVYVANDQALHTLRGTDADRDVQRLWALGARMDDEDVWGDDPGERPVLLGGTTITWQGDAFTITWEQYTRSFQQLPGYVAAISLGIEDRVGHRLLLPEKVLPVEPEKVTVTADEACDLSGFPRACGTGVSCQDLGQGPVCATPLAPVLTEAAIVLSEGRELGIRVRGTDGDLDARGMRLTFTLEAGGTKSMNTVYFNDTGTTWTGAAFEAVRLVSLPASYGQVTSVEVRVFDARNHTTDAVTLPWADVPRTLLAEGTACAPDDDLAVCAEGLVCGPELDGGHACAIPTAPVLYDVRLVTNPASGWLEVTVDGVDLDGDLYGVNLAFTGPGGRYLESLNANRMSPDPRGVDFFLSTGPVEDVPLAALTQVAVELVDAEGLRSNSLTVQLATALPRDTSCTRSSSAELCDLDEGLACSLDGTCETAVAPVVRSLVAHRVSLQDVVVDVELEDANGDAWDADVTLHVDGVARRINPPFVPFREPVYGLTRATSSLRFGGWADEGEVVDIEVAVRDLPGLLGASASVRVPPIVEVGGTCSGDDTVDACLDGSSCDAGTCVEHAPVLDTFTFGFEDEGRTARFELTGTEPDHDLEEVVIGATGDGVAPWTHAAVVGKMSGPQVTVTWAGDVFTAVVRVPDWGGVKHGDLDAATAHVGDARGDTSETRTLALAVTRNLGEACDPGGVLSRCQAGLSCELGRCETAVDACAGLELADLLFDGSPTADGWTLPVDLSGLEGVSLPTCLYSSSPARGGETAVAWTAPHAGTIEVSLELPTGTDIGLFVTSGQCVAPGEALVCSQRGAARTVDVEAGETLYFTLDAFSGSAPAGTLSVVWVE